MLEEESRLVLTTVPPGIRPVQCLGPLDFCLVQRIQTYKEHFGPLVGGQNFAKGLLVKLYLNLGDRLCMVDSTLTGQTNLQVTGPFLSDPDSGQTTGVGTQHY